MNPFEMVVGIVLITAIASVLKARCGVSRRSGRSRDAAEALLVPNPEAERLRGEVKALKDRVAVLERLATDSSAALDREFDKLRQQD